MCLRRWITLSHACLHRRSVWGEAGDEAEKAILDNVILYQVGDYFKEARLKVLIINGHVNGLCLPQRKHTCYIYLYNICLSFGIVPRRYSSSTGNLNFVCHKKKIKAFCRCVKVKKRSFVAWFNLYYVKLLYKVRHNKEDNIGGGAWERTTELVDARTVASNEFACNATRTGRRRHNDVTVGIRLKTLQGKAPC